LVFIHGYGGSGAAFYKIYKELGKHYKVFLVDLLGQGQSSRPDLNIPEFKKSINDTENYFVDSIEQWR
jgi:pimeloyl-ACP methyl ester carboxylesterase